MTALECHEVGRTYGALKAIDNVSLSVEAGEMHGLIGPNGAGKTTLLNLISGFVPLTSGRVTFAGHDVSRWSSRRRANAGLKRTFQTSAVFAEMTVREHLELACGDTSLFGLGRGQSERAAALAESWGLTPRMDQLVQEMSYGEQRLVDVAMAFAGEPTMVLLDEPTAGVDTNEIGELEGRLAQAKGRSAMVLISHDLDFLFSLCDRVTVLHHGQLLATGSAREIRSSPEVREAYLNTAIAEVDDEGADDE